MEPSIKNVRQPAGERTADDETRSTGSGEGPENTLTSDRHGVKQHQDGIKGRLNQLPTRAPTDAGGRSCRDTDEGEDRTKRGKNPGHGNPHRPGNASRDGERRTQKGNAGQPAWQNTTPNH